METKWVVSIYDRHKKCGIIKLVEDRSAETLITIIQQNMVPSAVIHSDCWKPYNSLYIQFIHFKSGISPLITNKISEMQKLTPVQI